MCSLNTGIMVDAKRFGISNCQLLDLDRIFHREHKNDNPSSLLDLLEGVC